MFIVLVSLLTISCVSSHGPAAPGKTLLQAIDGTRLNPYSHTWQQCALQEGRWQTSDPLTERLELLDDDTIRLTHTVDRAQGPTTVATMLLDRTHLGPTKLELTARLPDGKTKDLFAFDLTPAGYSGWSALTGEMEQKAGVITSNMLHGTILGLPLATLGPQSAPMTFTASMMNFDATYRIIAKWAGAKQITFNGSKIDVQLVDVEWHHNESGDVYPPGPNASGGRYWLITNPPAGLPYVIRYQTDTYAVEFFQSVCPP